MRLPSNYGEFARADTERATLLRCHGTWRHSSAVSKPWIVVACWTCACGSSAPPPAKPPVARPPVAQSALVVPARPRNVLYRDEIERLRSAGLGHLFELIDLEPVGSSDSDGRMITFDGFQIVALRPATEWLNFDFVPGDVLTHINGVSVEHYATWYEQFEALAKTDQIRVDLIRDGKPQVVQVQIVNRSDTKPQNSATRPAQPANAATAAHR